MYYVGIDGGGTYARLAGAESTASGGIRIIGRHAGNTTNLRSNTYDAVFNNIKKLVTEFNRLTGTKIEDCAGICIGSAGIDTPQNALEMEKLLKQVGFTQKVVAVNDAEIVLATETKGGAGVVVISGTGSVGYAVDKLGKPSRAGGWGHMIDDAGSGYWIGMQAIRRALEEFDGRGERTVLTERLLKHFGVKSPDEILRFIYSDTFNKSKVAELALLVKQAARDKDRAAMEIEEQAANELFRLARTLIVKSGLQDGKIVTGGSVLMHNDNIRARFTALVAGSFKEAQVATVKEKPEIGAIYLAMAE